MLRLCSPFLNLQQKKSGKKVALHFWLHNSLTFCFVVPPLLCLLTVVQSSKRGRLCVLAKFKQYGKFTPYPNLWAQISGNPRSRLRHYGPRNICFLATWYSARIATSITSAKLNNGILALYGCQRIHLLQSSVLSSRSKSSSLQLGSIVAWGLLLNQMYKDVLMMC